MDCFLTLLDNSKGRIYKPGDGIDSPIKNDQSKYVTLFNQKIIELQKDFSEKIIGHVNPYTGLTYADDPAMANLELTNENSLFNGWLGWNSDYIFGDVTNGIGPFYSNELDTFRYDYYRPKFSEEKLPVIISLHGGGFTIGDKGYIGVRSDDRYIDSVDPVSFHVEHGQPHAIDVNRVTLVWHVARCRHEEARHGAVRSAREGPADFG